MNFKIKKTLPSLFTFGNLVFGFISIIKTAEGEFVTAAWLIAASSLFDALDGAVARLTKTASEFGVQLDSLSDILSFGAAPAFLMYKTILFDAGELGMAIAVLFVVAGGFRLARYNVAATLLEKNDFTGLPIPMAALTSAAFIIVFNSNPVFIFENMELVAAGFVLLQILMVSRVKYETLPKFSMDGIKEKPLHFVFLAASVVVVAIFGEKMLFYVFIFIVLFGIFQTAFGWIFKKTEAGESNI